ncbi:glycoside hydrolase [Fimicolochytrium jonesii]|uniref:glycoside hydrolase n=1 Tax=Fimicolochytrium jonesii TaxID=1396493 RepID=UPI0022FF3C73|nr:glycoside hydrolase [Fimicolochytrium jonesii]KAI8820688.1 glycoside hydrolase [Fimicolochytrium jonesii]
MPEERDQADREMMKTVQNMMIHAWDSYYKTAAGADELKPVSGGKHNWYGETSVLSTPIDAMDTLRMMGLDSRYEQAKGLVLKNLDFDIDVEVNLFETTIRVLGGLLSAWEFDDDPRYLKLAEDLADRMMGAFDTPTGLPLNFFNLKHKNASGHGTTLSQAGTLQLELQYLSDVTGNAKYAEKALKVYDIMHSAGFAIKGLYPIEWSTDNIDGIKNGAGQRYGLGANSDSFYEYMLKVWMATGEEKYREWYDESAEALKTHLVERKGDRVFVPDARYASTEAVHKVDSIHHLTCFAGGMFSTGALTRRRSYWTAFLDIGRSITHTCWEAYKRTPTGLGPDEWVMDTMVAKDTNYFLRPETIESIFYMWRFTHDETYREMGRAFAASLNKHCKLANGFSGLLDVSSKGPANHRDLQESFFLAETLKYLYLLFADDDTIPLEAFVFNTEGHPLSMRGWGRRKGLKRGSSGVGAGKKGIRDVENKAKEAKLQKIDVSGLAFEAKGVGSKESTGPANLASGDPSLEVSA